MEDRHGCPLLPLLFGLSVEPLAIAIRTMGSIRGFRRGADEEKISLYADVILLFLGDANHSLTAVMDIIKGFGLFSGPGGWSRTGVTRGAGHLQVVESFKYLGT